MARKVEKQLQEYGKLISGELKNNSAANFYASEINEIYEISGGDIYTAISKALDFGFVCGYKTGKRVVKREMDK